MLSGRKIKVISIAITTLLFLNVPAFAIIENSITDAHISQARGYALAPLIHSMINEIRVQHGLVAIFEDYDLDLIALHNSKDMASRDFFAHINPDGLSPNDRATQAGYKCEIKVGNTIYSIGENIGKVSIYDGYTYNPDSGQIIEYDMRSDDDIARSIVTAWMESPGHKANILREFWGSEGLGIHITPEGLVLVTQLFC